MLVLRPQPTVEYLHNLGKSLRPQRNYEGSTLKLMASVAEYLEVMLGSLSEALPDFRGALKVTHEETSGTFRGLLTLKYTNDLSGYSVTYTFDSYWMPQTVVLKCGTTSKKLRFDTMTLTAEGIAFDVVKHLANEKMITRLLPGSVSV